MKKADNILILLIFIICIIITLPLFAWYHIERYESEDKYPFQIQGIVFFDDNGNGFLDSGELMAPGIGVSDGRDVVLSDDKGHYCLNNSHKDANIVFITIPSCYEKNRRFYYLLHSDDNEKVFDFPLVKSQVEEKDTFNFIQITDIHLWNEAEIPDFKQKLCRMEKDNPLTAFIIATGDLGNDNRINTLANFIEVASTVPEVWHYGIGNHDEIYTDDYTKIFRQIFGPDYYSFDYAGWHFIMHDCLHLKNHKMNTDWFRNDIEKLGSGKNIAIFTHFDPDSDQFNFWGQYPNIKAVFSGHRHGIKNLNVNNILSFNTGTFRMGGIDYTPAGYRVMTVERDSIFSNYRFFKCDVVDSDQIVKIHDDSIIPVNISRKKTSWTQFHGSGSRNGRISDAISADLTVCWKTQVDGSLLSSGMVASDGKLILPVRNYDKTDRNFIYCLNIYSGEIIWRKKLQSPIIGSPTISENRIYLQDVTGMIMCMDFNGNVLWENSAGAHINNWSYGTPVVENNKVYCGNTVNMLAVDRNSGSLIWHKKYNDVSSFSNVILTAGDNWLISGAVWTENNLIIMKKNTGNIMMKLDHQGVANAVVYSKPYVIVAGYYGDVIVYNDTDWSTYWAFKMGEIDGVVTTPAVYDSQFYVINAKGCLYAYDLKKRKELWSFSVPHQGLYDMIPYNRTGECYISSLLVNKKYVIMTGSDGYCYFIDRKTGELKEQINFGEAITTEIAVCGDMIFLGTFEGNVYGIVSNSNK